jgi:hypothetical protein
MKLKYNGASLTGELVRRSHNFRARRSAKKISLCSISAREMRGAPFGLYEEHPNLKSCLSNCQMRSGPSIMSIEAKGNIEHGTFGVGAAR